MADLNDHERTTILRLLTDGEAAGEFECSDHRGAAARLMALRDGLAIEHTLFDLDRTTDDMVRQIHAALRVRPRTRSVCGRAATFTGETRFVDLTTVGDDALMTFTTMVSRVRADRITAVGLVSTQ